MDLVQSTSGTETEVSIVQLVPGSYSIALLAPDGRVATHSFELAPEQELVVEPLELRPGGFVEVHYEGSTEIGQLELEVDGVPYDKTSLRAGRTETLRSATGEARLHVSSRNVATGETELNRTYTVEVIAGATAKLNVASSGESADD